MKVNEIFYSLQGEGHRSGEPSIFVRLSGCDMECGFCDTEFESGKEMSVDEIHNTIAAWPCRWIVWTGGEPLLQLTQQAVGFFNKLGYYQAIETNGNHTAPDGLSWIACSPKVAEHVLKKNFPDGVDELRYVRHAGQPAVPVPSITAKEYYLSPMFKGDKIDSANLRNCIRLCLENPQWRLSVQMHKLFKIQ